VRVEAVVVRSTAAYRQLATSARRHVQEHRTRQVSRTESDTVVSALTKAARTGDIAGLIAVLDPDVVLRSDGGGLVTAARNLVFGADRVARFLLGALTKNPTAEVLDQETPDGLGFVLWDEGRIFGVVTFEVTRGAIARVRLMMNPNKLTLWN